MKSSLILAASAAVVGAQVTNNNGTFTCSKPNVNFCAGDSLGTDIIFRCNAQGIAQPGRCTDNLAGQPPQGVQPALCYQSGPTVGDAACEKNCVVYPENGGSPFTLPAADCTPYYTSTVSSYPPTTTSTYVPPTYTPTTYPTYTPTYSPTYPPTSSCPSTMTTSTKPTSSPCPPTSTYPPPPPHSTGGSSPPPGNNGTYSPTHLPPTKPGFAPTTVPTAGASVNQVGGALAALGLVAAALL